jgi:hypothetical protein
MVRMSTVWDRATEFVGDNLAAIMPLAIAILCTVALQDLLARATDGADQMVTLAINGFGLVIALISLFARLAVMGMAIDDRRTAGDGLALVLGRLLAVIGVFFVVGFFFMLLFLPLVIVPIAAGLDVAQFSHPTAETFRSLPSWAILVITFYALAIGILALWLATRLALVLPVMLEERRGLGALRRSFTLTRGLALRILGVMLLLGLVAAVATLAAKTVFGTVFRLLLGDAGPFSATNILTAIVVGAVAALFTVIGDAFTGKLYLATRDAEADAVAEGA